MKAFILILLFFGVFSSATLAASLNLDVSTLNFGSMTPSATPQMLGTPINITWDASGLTNWKMRIYTDNTRVSANPIYTGTLDPAGLVGATTTDRTIGLKVWCANYGPGASPPDVSNAASWSDNWFYILDYSRISSAERILMRKGTELAAPFPIYLAALFNSRTVAQGYRTSTLTVELIEQ